MPEIQGLAPPDTAPDKAIPIPITTPSPPHIPSAQTLQSWLPLYFCKADASIDRLSKIISTRSGTDTLLLTLCYSSLLTSTVLSSISLHRLRNAARQFIEKAVSLQPNEAVIIDTSNIPPSRLLIASARLKKLSSMISEFRMFGRLLGMVGIYKWAKAVLENPPEDPFLRTISYAQVMVNIFYQYLENGAYLSSKGVLGWSSERQNRAWVVSSRFWMAHVAMDFIRLYQETAIKNREPVIVGEKEDPVVQEAESAWKAKWRKEMVVDLAYAPLTVHWSLEKGLVTPFWVGLLGSIAGVTGLRVLWKNAA